MTLRAVLSVQRRNPVNMGSLACFRSFASNAWSDTLFVYQTYGKLVRAVRYALSCCLHPKASRDWRTLIMSAAFGTIPDDTRCDFLLKIFRPFARNWMNVPARVHVLLDHYAVISQALSASLYADILCEKDIHVCELVGKTGHRFNLSFSRSRRYGKEGELTFKLEDADHCELLATVTGTVALTQDNRPVLIIGGLQGAKRSGKDIIVQATRSLDGLRPKAVVFEGLCAFANQLGCTEIFMPRLSVHISSGWKWWRHRHITAEYDQFWEGLGGIPVEPFEYTLPLPLPRRSIDVIPSKKRPDWKRRQERIRHIQDSVCSLFPVSIHAHMRDDDLLRA